MTSLCRPIFMNWCIHWWLWWEFSCFSHITFDDNCTGTIKYNLETNLFRPDQTTNWLIFQFKVWLVRQQIYLTSYNKIFFTNHQNYINILAVEFLLFKRDQEFKSSIILYLLFKTEQIRTKRYWKIKKKQNKKCNGKKV